MRRGPFVILLVLAAVLAAGADTIILKSGRRISATQVHEEGERVVYETPAGVMSLPKSIVDHVERGPSAIYASGGGGGTAAVAASMAAAPPPVSADNGLDDVAKAVLPNGSIDRTYLLKLDGDAQSGGKQAVERMAVGHHVAAQFELRKGDLDQAVNQYQRALTLAPDHVGLLLNLSGVMIRQSQFTQAIDVLDRAQRVAPKDFYVQKFLGIAYYGANKLDQAVDAWKRALEIRPDAEVQQQLEKAQRDKEEEANYREGISAHFNLKYNGEAAPALAREVLKTLEQHFNAIESELNYTPRETISVVLYTDQAFANITRAPSWVGALNDGRIRVPVRGLTAMTSELSLDLKHELVHSFVGQKTRNRCPTWLNEGLAQWFEGERSGTLASVFVTAFDQSKQAVPLANLEGSWMGLSGDQAQVAYGWGLSVTEYIIATDGMRDIERLLDHIASDPGAETAAKNVLRMEYSELEEETIKYLRKNYVR
jgi:Tetratricopeptide repeat